MTIVNQATSVTYTGNSATYIWPFSFVIPNAESIVVTLIDNSGVVPVETVINPVLFEVPEFNNPLGGTVTFPLTMDDPPISASYQLRIDRLVPYVQETDLANQDNFYPKTIEDALDYLTMQTQQLSKDFELIPDLQNYVNEANAAAVIAYNAAIAAGVSQAAAVAAALAANNSAIAAAASAASIDPTTFVKRDGTQGPLEAMTWLQVSAPSNPAVGSLKLYPKVDGKFYTLDNAGTEVELGSGSGTAFCLVATDFPGVDPTGATDSRVGLQAAIDAASALKCPLYIPGGLYNMTNNGDTRCLYFRDDVDIFGAGIGATTLRLDDGEDAHMIEGDGVSNIALRHMTLDGNRATQTIAGHGIRVTGDGVQYARFCDLHVMNCYSYSIGLQDGDNEYVYLERLVLENSGADGIDLKQKGTISSGPIWINDVHVISFGQRGDLTTQAGIDIRGIVHLRGIRVDNVDLDKEGIRFRFGEAGDGLNGAGGHYSTLSGFYIEGTTTGSSIGLGIGARNVKVSNGNILSCVRASIIFQRECSLVNVESLGCTNGFLLDAGAGLTSEADLCQLTGCTVRSASGVAFDVESDQVILNGCIARSSGTSFRTVSGALATSIVGCQSVLATTSHFTNGGSGTLVSGCAGIADQNGAIANKTADFSVSTSEKWLTLNKASTCVVTLPTASASAAREIWVKNEVAQLLNSASSNVVPKTGGAAGTAILPATDGAWACLVSDGTNWIIMSSGV